MKKKLMMIVVAVMILAYCNAGGNEHTVPLPDRAELISCIPSHGKGARKCDWFYFCLDNHKYLYYKTFRGGALTLIKFGCTPETTPAKKGS